MIAFNCFIIIIKSPELNKIKDHNPSSAQLKIQMSTKTIFVALKKNFVETITSVTAFHQVIVDNFICIKVGRLTLKHTSNC